MKVKSLLKKNATLSTSDLQMKFKNYFLRKLHQIRKKAIIKFGDVIHFNDSESKIASDSQDYWNQDYSNPILAQDAHWKNKGIFEDHQRWLSMGKEHLDLILSYSSILGFQLPVKQIVDWGCGGGANAVHFAPFAEKYIGIDITSESLAECKKQILECGINNFHPILIDASSPESILTKNINEVDLFHCLYVFEQFPSPAYGLNILKIANKMLKNDGVAFIQIRYNDGRKEEKPKRWGYKLRPYRMTTYTLEEFWENAKAIGFEPVGIFLKPQQPLVRDTCYAYYFLKKKFDC